MQVSETEAGASTSGASSASSAGASVGGAAGSDTAGSAGAVVSARAGASSAGDGGADQVAPSAGTGGVGSAAGAGGDSGGAAALGGSVSAGGVQQGGAAGSADPLEPYPAPGCNDWTAYRVPPGKFLAISGNFQNALFESGHCQVPVGLPYYESCSAVGNVSQCVCSVTSPPSCGQSCDGAYLVTVLKAEPGKTFHAELQDGDGHCIAGVPVAK